MRPLSELVAWWPVADSRRLRHVCRPTLPIAGHPGTCFTRAVPAGPAWAIALATDPDIQPAGPPAQRAAAAPIAATPEEIR